MKTFGSHLARRIFPSVARFSLCASIFAGATAQVPDSPVAPGTAPSPSSSPPAAAPQSKAPGVTPNSSFLGKDLPAFDPGTDMFMWDGKSWNATNHRIFQARFEKYLNAPEATSTDDRQYQAIIAEVLARLAPGSATRENVDHAFKLLNRGSHYDADARLCDALADAVYTVWMAKREQQRLYTANQAMNYEIQLLELAGAGRRKATEAAKESNRRMRNPGGRRGAAAPPAPPPTVTEESADAKEAVQENADYKTRRWTEMIARQKGNDVKRELSEIQAKVEYQALLVQFFLQRRFQHVLMATRFYRAIFSDGDSKLNVGNETKDLFTKTAGMPPTVTTLDSLANEAIRDVREGVRAFEFLLGKEELESASKRLAEAFTVGEFLPEIRTLTRDKKRRVVTFVQKSNELLAKMETKDFTGAERLIAELATIAKDFDASRPKGMIDTARQASRLHLAAARNAALSGDKETLRTELTAAGEIWPLNPELAEISQKIFNQGDVMQRAILDFDQLYGQKNYRRILEESARFIAATAQDPERQTQLKAVLRDMQTVEAALLRAEEMKRQSNFAGAWESVEKVAGEFPEDSKLNQARADLTTQAAEFVRTLRNAEEMEKREHIGAALAWFLKAQKIYPGSDFAEQGIDRMKKTILPQN